MLRVTVHKVKHRSDGESVYLCNMIGNPHALFLCHLNAEGEIKDSKFFDCGGVHDKIVRAQALHEFNIWKHILITHIDDYEIGPAILSGRLPQYLSVDDVIVP